MTGTSRWHRERGSPSAAPGGLELNVERIGEIPEIVVHAEEELHQCDAGIVINFSMIDYVDQGEHKEDARGREFSVEPVRHGVQLLSGKVFPNKTRHKRAEPDTCFAKMTGGFA